MSRKTILTVTAVFGAVLAVFVAEFGLSINATALAAGLGSVLYWVFREGKEDLKKIGAQCARFKDPKFWLTVISAFISALATAGINLPISPEIIIAVLTAIVGILFKAAPSARAA